MNHVVPEMVTVTQLVKNSMFYWIWRFITEFSKICPWTRWN